MRSNYKKVGNYIRKVNIRNVDLVATNLLGINIDKFFMPSVANVVGTDMATYKIVKKGQFSCNRMHVGRDYRLPVSISKSEKAFLVSPAYDVFEVKDEKELLPEYLMMWFSRAEYDRNAWFYTDADVRGGLHWDAFCEMALPIPSVEKQKEIVRECYVIQDRIRLNNELIQKLEETIQAIYKQWFVDFDDLLDEEVLDKYIEFNPRHSISKNDVVSYVEMSDVQEHSMGIKNIIKREFTSGSKFKNNDTLLARITPCLENGKTAFVNCLEDNEVAFGSTEFIVMRAKNNISPYWIYCLARDEKFRSHAISSMVGSSGRQRVHSDYLKEFMIPKIEQETMEKFHRMAQPVFLNVKLKTLETKNLVKIKDLLLSKLATIKI